MSRSCLPKQKVAPAMHIFAGQFADHQRSNTLVQKLTLSETGLMVRLNYGIVHISKFLLLRNGILEGDRMWRAYCVAL